jgi:DnaJ domain
MVKPISSASEELNHYQMLGFEPPYQIISADEIKKSYRKLALEFHPDKKPDDKTTMQKLAAASETLLDPVKKAVYDQILSSEDDEKKFLELVESEFAKPAGSKNPEVAKIEKYCLRRAIDEAYQAQNNDGLLSKAFQDNKKVINFTFTCFSCSVYYANKCICLAVEFLIHPIQHHIEKLKNNPDSISAEKILQLQAALSDINDTIYNAIVIPVKKEERGQAKYEVSHKIKADLIALVIDYSKKETLNSHRNLVRDIFRGLAGVVVTLFTAIPTAGLIVLSSDYRRIIKNTFFSTKSKAELVNASVEYKSATLGY